MRAEIDASLSSRLGSGWDRSPMVLITGHRRENFGEGIRQICEAITILARRYPDHRFVYPVHLNPEVKGQVDRLLGGLANVQLIAPLGYREFVALMAHARLILTDSGGVQEEAPSLGSPSSSCVTPPSGRRESKPGPRSSSDRTRPASWSTRAGCSTIPRRTGPWRTCANPFGDGHAAERIVSRVRRHLA